MYWCLMNDQELSGRFNSDATYYDESSSSSDGETIDIPNLNVPGLSSETSLKTLLQQKINDSLSSSIKERANLSTQTLSSALRNELKFWVDGGSRGLLLDKIYENLLHISQRQPASKQKECSQQQEISPPKYDPVSTTKRSMHYAS